MTLTSGFSLFFTCFVTFLSIARAQGRAPHGLTNQHPIAFSPTAYDFFHPDTQHPNTMNPCASTGCSPLPLAAQVEATPAHESKDATSQKGRGGVGAGGIATIVFSFTFVVLSAMGVYYVVIRRRENMSKGKSVRPYV